MPKAKDRWIKFVAEHGVVLASAKGPVPSVAAAVAGAPIAGSWWAHPKSQQIFEALASLDASPDIRCFRLVDHKLTFVHRRLWPALARLAHDGILEPERVAAVRQEHLPSGEHRNVEVAFPDWLPDDAAAKALMLTADAARAQLGPWVD